ncbi:MAG: hypothetical protein V7606_1744 [Burkholderiales bacterium]
MMKGGLVNAVDRPTLDNIRPPQEEIMYQRQFMPDTAGLATGIFVCHLPTSFAGEVIRATGIKAV